MYLAQPFATAADGALHHKQTIMASSARIDELRKKFEENPRRYFAPLANEYRKAGDIEQAIAICREYLPQQPGHMSGHIVYGQALYEARQVEEAKTVFETALSLDPENLIALRHLGDIALMIGDTQAARIWYGRVLEADPRNEEIQAQLAAIDQAAASAPTPTAAPSFSEQPTAPLPPLEASKPTPSSAQTVVVSAQQMSRPTPVVPLTAQSTTVEIPTDVAASRAPTVEVKVDSVPAAKAGDTTLAFEPTSFVPPAESPVPSSDEPAPLDSFSLEGLETTSLTEPPPAPAPPPLEARVQAPPEALELPPLDVPVDLPLDVPSAEAAEPPLPPAHAAEAPTPEADLQFLDLGTPVPAVEAVPEAPAAEPPTPVLEDWSPPPAETAAEAGPFVTETMAELYLHQGHREEALRVYRALLEQRPGDAALASKVAALSMPAPAVGAAVAQPVDLPPVPSGPTIREILTAIATRRPGTAVPHGNGATPQPTPPAESQQAAEGAAQAPPSASLPDALGALFGGARISAPDERAAATLALAFMDLNGLERSGEISGAPARHATNDLSLDAVFKSSELEPAAPSSFSFDQFFSQRATAEHTAATRAAPAAAPESRDDVAQFTQWLEGLKQK